MFAGSAESQVIVCRRTYAQDVSRICGRLQKGGARKLTAEALLKYVVSLQAKHREELGFLPRLALSEYVDRGQVWPSFENGDVVGYCLFYDGRNGHGPVRHPDVLKVHQVCTQYDARNLWRAAGLIGSVIRRAEQGGFRWVTARVAQEIDANGFWRAMGFELRGIVAGGAKRGRKLNVWRLRVREERRGGVLGRRKGSGEIVDRVDRV